AKSAATQCAPQGSVIDRQSISMKTCSWQAFDNAGTSPLQLMPLCVSQSRTCSYSMLQNSYEIDCALQSSTHAWPPHPAPFALLQNAKHGAVWVHWASASA